MSNLWKTRAPAVLTLALVICSASAVTAAVVNKSGSFYSIKVETAGQGDSRTATITVTGLNGYHCNMLYPWKLTVDPAEGLTFDKNAFKAGPNQKKDATKYGEDAIVFTVPYKVGANAAKNATATLKLSLCDDKQCQMEAVNLSWTAI